MLRTENGDDRKFVRESILEILGQCVESANGRNKFMQSPWVATIAQLALTHNDQSQAVNAITIRLLEQSNHQCLDDIHWLLKAEPGLLKHLVDSLQTGKNNEQSAKICSLLVQQDPSITLADNETCLKAVEDCCNLLANTPASTTIVAASNLLTSLINASSAPERDCSLTALSVDKMVVESTIKLLSRQNSQAPKDVEYELTQLLMSVTVEVNAKKRCEAHVDTILLLVHNALNRYKEAKSDHEQFVATAWLQIMINIVEYPTTSAKCQGLLSDLKGMLTQSELDETVLRKVNLCVKALTYRPSTKKLE